MPRRSAARVRDINDAAKITEAPPGVEERLERFFDPDQTSITQFLAPYKIATKKLQDAGGIERRTVYTKFVLRPVQERILALIEAEWAAGRGAQLLILKDRQQGCSTLGMGLLWERLCRGGGGFGKVVSHKDDATKELFTTLRTFSRQTTSLEWGQPGHLTSDTGGSITLQFGEFEQSSVKVQTSRDGAMGRSTANRWLWITELPWWTQGKSELGGLLESWEDAPGNLLVIESTANGMEEFHQMWEAATREGGYSNVIPVFLSWLEHPHKRHAVPAEFAEDFEESIGKLRRYGEREERALVKRGADLEQLYWRRIQIDSPKINGDLKIFMREHPSTPDEAFSTSGNAFFNRDQLKAWRKVAVKQEERDGVRGSFVIRKKGRIAWLDDPDGLWLRLADVEKDVVYGWAADTASGAKKHADGRREADFCTMQIGPVLGEQVVCQLRAHLQPRAHAREVMKAALYYNRAMGYGERSVTGDTGAMLAKLEDMEIGDELGAEILLSEKRIIETDLGTTMEKWVGFATKGNTRKLILEQLRDFVKDMGWPKEGTKTCPLTVGTLEEMIRFEVKSKTTPGGKPTVRIEAASGHDDLVLTRALLGQAYDQLEDEVAKATPRTRQQSIYERMIRGMMPNQGRRGRDRDMGRYG